MKSLKNISYRLRVMLPLLAAIGAAQCANAGTDTWNGGGGSSNVVWQSGANWVGGNVPAAGDQLVFTNTVGLVNVNNYLTGTIFAGITFATPSGAFVLNGNTNGNVVVITNSITDNQAFTPETITQPIQVNAGFTPTVTVAANGVLNLNGQVLGAGGLTTAGSGLVNLNASNIFTGVLTIGGSSTVAVTTNLSGGDFSLGAAPAVPTAGSIVINGGALQTTANFLLNTNRGIALGPTSGSGSGTLNVNSGTILTSGGVMANNGGGTGGLTKVGFGSLILNGGNGGNTYTGPTTNTIGAIFLDFTKPVSPLNNIISSSSALAMGGGNAGPTTTNAAQLIMEGTSAGNSQTFASASFTLGASVIGVTNLSGSGLNTLNLGVLNHTPGSGLTFFSSTPGTLAKITTTSPNTGGILGGWATIAGDAGGPSLPSDNLPTGTNWACVDISGNIVQFNNYFTVNTANSNILLHATVDANTTGVETNLLVGDGISGGSVIVARTDNDGAGTTTDINSIKFYNSPSSGGEGVFIGTNNTLRLGVYGGILSVQTANTTPVIGGVSNMVNGITANQAPFGSTDAGNLTAGGPNNNTPGEIVITHSTTQGETTGGLIVAAKITDNGSGKVTVIKMGNGSIKLDGDNTYSGGLYLLQGRVQWQGTEIQATSNGGPGGTNGINDGAGYGPVYVFPGSYFAPSTQIPNITNAFFVAGAGGANEKFGVFRGGNFGGNITMIGDATMCSDSANVFGPIHGPFNLTIGAPNRNGVLSLANSGDDWTGNTIMAARNTLNVLISSNNEVIPNGFGKGNVSVVGAASANFIWNMNGFSEAVNGFSSSGVNGGALVVSNGLAYPLSTLTIGDNDQSGTFGGVIKSNIALTKIGAGVETLTNVNSYNGATTVSNGVLQLTGVASIANSGNINIFGGAFDVSQVSGFSFGGSQPVSVSGGTLLISGASSSGAVNFTNGTLQVGSVGAAPNLTVSTLGLGGSANIISVLNVGRQGVIPVTFPVVAYTTLNGDPTTLGVKLSGGFTGFVSNNATAKTVFLVITNGPLTPIITWKGLNGVTVDSDWDLITPDWRSNSTPVDYVDGAIAQFNDSASTSVVNISAANFSPNFGPLPGDTFVSNTVTYTFTGSGGIGGTNHLTKQGTGKLILDNGGDTYSGGLIISGGTVQLGVNDTGGSLGSSANPVSNNGTLIFNRSNSNLVITNSISGSGSLSNSTATTLTLSGANAIGGSIGVVTGSILQAGNNSALGATNVIPSGAALDVNGKNLAQEVVVTSGTGVNPLVGAIYNSAAGAASPALARLTLLGDTTFGAPVGGTITSNRWDLRSATITDANGASLSTGGNAYNLIKVGNNQVSISGVTVDPALANIDVQQGVLSIEAATTGLGNPANTLTVENGADLSIFQATNQFNKNIVLDGNGINNNLGTVNSTSGNNTIAGLTTLNGNVEVTYRSLAGAQATSGSLTLNNLTGNGSLQKEDTNTTLIVSGTTDGHTGGTTVNGGIFLLNTINHNVASGLTNVSLSTIGGNGTNMGTVWLQGALFPGVGGKPSTFGVGNTGGGGLLELDFNGAPQLEFSLGATNTVGGGVNDLININGDLDGEFEPVIINETAPLQNGTYTLIKYTGSELSPLSTFLTKTVNPTRYTYSLDQTTVPHVVSLMVSGAQTQLKWNNATGDGLWNVAASSNWLNQTTSAQDIFDNLDTVVLDDSFGSPTNIVTINTNSAASTTNSAVIPGLLLVNNATVSQVINGPGKISGGASVVKMGTGNLTINNANDFTGTTTISNGVLTINNTNALGGVNNAIIVNSGGTLDIGGASFTVNLTPMLGSKPIFIAGMGVGNKGAIINSGGVAQEFGLQNITLTADAAIGGDGPINGAGRFDIGRITPATLSTGGHAYNLFKVGTNQVSLVSLTVDTNLADVDIQGGELGIENATTSLGNPANKITVESGATLEFFNVFAPFNKVIIVNGGALAQGFEPNIWFNSGPTNIIAGPVTLTNGLVVIGGAGSVTFSNTVSGPSALRIAGGVAFAGTNTYTGDTSVSNNGTLFLTGTGSIAQSTNITLQSGSKIDVSGRANGTLTLAGQTLTGSGTINGTLTNLSGSILLTGTNGSLTVTTNATFGGTALIANQLDHGSNTVFTVGGNITYGGTLTVTTNAASTTTLTAGTSYRLFKAATYNGTFGTLNLPALPAGLNWTNGLAVDGSIGITSSGAGTFTTPPGNLTFSINGANVTINGTGGQAGDAYYLLQSTNVALPLSQWNVVATNVLNANGSFTFNGTNVVVPGDKQQFYILSNTNSNH